MHSENHSAVCQELPLCECSEADKKVFTSIHALFLRRRYGLCI